MVAHDASWGLSTDSIIFRTLKLLREQSDKMGKEYDSPKSKAHIMPFIQSFDLQDSMSEMVEPDPNVYHDFNEFFAREIKESARPIQNPGSELVSSSPADCRLTAFPTIDMATKYWVKGHGFTLERLLGDAQLAKDFNGGAMVIARLAPQVRYPDTAPSIFNCSFFLAGLPPLALTRHGHRRKHSRPSWRLLHGEPASD